MLKKILSLLIKQKILLILFIFSFLIRFVFIFEDMPFITHPDEPTIVNSTLNLKYDLNPKHFDWPTFYYYINYLFFSVLFLLERFLNRIGYPNPEVVAIENFYLLSRIVTCVFGSLSVVFMYKLVFNITRRNEVSLLASIILSILPFHITRSAQSLTDVPMAFFFICSLYYLSKNLENFSWRNIYLASLFVGFATSTKYNGYMASLSVMLFVFLIKRFSFKDTLNYLYSISFASLGFLIGTPYSLLDFKTFIRDDGPKGALWQFKNVGSLGFTSQVEAFFTNITSAILPDVAFLPWVAALIFIFFYFFKKDYLPKNNYSKFILILIIQFFFILWSVSGVKIQRSHYFIGLYALIPVFSSIILSKNSKLMYGVLLTTSIISTYLLVYNMMNNSRVEFYDRVVFTNEKKNYNILYSDSELKEVLRKLDIKSDEFDPNKMDFNSKYYSHIISSKDLCPGTSNCSYKLVEKILNKEKGNDLLIYEIIK